MSPSFDETTLAVGSGAPVFDFEGVYSKIFDAKTSQESLDAAVALANGIAAEPTTAHNTLAELLPRIAKAAADKKSGTNRESAMIVYGAFYETLPSKAPCTEVFLLESIGNVYDALADKGAVVRESAQYAIDALFNTLKLPVLVSGLLKSTSKYLASPGSKWQGKVAAFTLVGKLAEKAVKREQDQGDVFMKDVIGRELEHLIPVVESGMHDLKAEVSKAAVKATTSLCKVLSNDDVSKHIPTLIKTMNMPSKETQAKAIHDLSQTTFVQTVTSPVLSLLTPLLERALNSPQTTQEVLRQVVVVTENLTKLVHDPVEAREFLPRLQPGVKRVLDTAAIPAVRELAQNANDIMVKAMRLSSGSEPSTIGERISVEEVANQLALKSAGRIRGPEVAVWEAKIKPYLAEMAREVIVIRQWDLLAGCFAPYLKDIIYTGDEDSIAANVEKWARETDEERFGNVTIIEDEYKNEVEIVNAQFSLAYGGMMLLNHTKLRLHRGHRYGLCGRNGAGKSTLMRSIAEGKLEGFPSKDELRTCFVEHRSQGAENALPIVEYIRNSLIEDNLAEGFLGDDGTEKIKETLRAVGFEGERVDFKVGELSGGWKMKLALAEAMLKKAEVLLLDEPTNHLDVGNVRWLQDYLKEHTDITSLIVSHDSGFLDEVCTDIIHYENKKLVHYKGNLADFVKVRPEGKAYYTLSSSTVAFKFPPPGILSGVTSRTRSIMKMTNCTFTYPNAAKPSLYNMSCSLSLSSRVALLGANGAGKSTLIKVLTGEVIPQEGKVEKHPNLRVGYLSQHSLEPLQFHLDKTPSQYLQWRYANGDDREVLMKATRKLSAEEEEQMNTPIDLGDGKGAKRIQNIVGRQKYKKSFQYEIQWVGLGPKSNTMISRETLMKLGFFKLIQEFDDHEASREGLGFRKLEAADIRKHFEDVGLDADLAEHNEIGGMSGGQKVKIVIAGAMWNNPHLLVLDEPTNYLDRESLGGLSHAIRDFKGGVIVISHHEEFVSALCNEQWVVDAGKLITATKNAADSSKFESGTNTPALSTPGPSAVPSAVTSAAPSATSSAVNSDNEDDMKFKGRKFPKKKKLTRAQQKDREVRRRLRHIEWLNSPKGTPKPVDTDDEAE
ncbi:Similar to [NU+] prion formation protein 1; acc. no. Q08972 [Pyronema omphalodes CBS 100304]|uniref:Similar to [NU+] prion formation protein 1 acc. no. Q08972 n=1 Tax=Pyronema omphalodes (strain CBS 100304) TaxID=1076935 RepID=U4L2Q9_PYROM|nr:Similar to [NU+] prion formation protein 1; acc. no. Q08972 [Pyronema omphalodes CBS 100304]